MPATKIGRVLLWIWTLILVLAVGGGTVWGILLFANERDQPRMPGYCGPDAFRTATVDANVRVAIADLNVPRITAEVRIKIPRNTSRAADFVRASDDPWYRFAIACVLFAVRDDYQVRDAVPQVSVVDGNVEIVQRSHIDVVRAGEVWAEVARVDNPGDGPWRLTVVAPTGLWQAKWNVSIAAPEGWLSSPNPWEPVSARTTELRWSNQTPNTSSGWVAFAHVEPDLRATVTTTASSQPWVRYQWGFSWLSALVLLAAAIWPVFRRGPAPQQENERLTARRAMVPLLVVVPIVCGLAVTTAVMGEDNVLPQVGWFVDLGLALLTAVLAWRWWLPRILAILIAAVALAGLTLVRFWGEGIALKRDTAVPWEIDALHIGGCFIVTFLLIMAVVKALHVLLSKGVRKRRSAPLWLWITSALGAAALVIEKAVIIHANQERREWLGLNNGLVNRTGIYRYYLWDLYDEFAWLLLLVVAAAVWHRYARYRFEPSSRSALFVAGVFFVVGPMWLDIVLWGVTVPIWPIIAVVAAAGGCFVTYLWKPVLSRISGERPTMDAQRARAREWYLDEQRSRSGTTPVDVLLALGPGGHPQGNLERAMRLGAVPALMAGIALCVSGWLVYPLLLINQEDSVLLRFVDDIGWEVAKWVLAAAAVGLAWQHLPGKRGVVKVLPVISLYAVGPILLVGTTWASDGAPDWIPVASCTLFAVVLMVLGLRMDRAALEGVAVKGSGPIRTLLNAYGLENFSTRLTALLTPVLLVLAVWSAINGGDVSFPNVDQTQLPRP